MYIIEVHGAMMTKLRTMRMRMAMIKMITMNRNTFIKNERTIAFYLNSRLSSSKQHQPSLPENEEEDGDDKGDNNEHEYFH
jgi:hypothetical protein